MGAGFYSVTLARMTRRRRPRTRANRSAGRHSKACNGGDHAARTALAWTVPASVVAVAAGFDDGKESRTNTIDFGSPTN